VRYAHLFWKLFGLPITGWDDLLYDDLAWMKSVADKYEASQKEAARG
jgi:hypothetical protein